MFAANRIKVYRGVDHFIVRFSASSSDDANDEGTEVTSVMLPLTVGARLALSLFRWVLQAGPGLTKFYEELGTEIVALNQLSAEHLAKEGNS